MQIILVRKKTFFLEFCIKEYFFFYNSIFQPGVRGTQRFHFFFTGFRENPQKLHYFKYHGFSKCTIMFQRFCDLKKVENHCCTRSVIILQCHKNFFVLFCYFLSEQNVQNVPPISHCNVTRMKFVHKQNFDKKRKNDVFFLNFLPPL